MFEGVPVFWRDKVSLDALRDEQGFDPPEDEGESFWSALRPALVREPAGVWTRQIVEALDLNALELLDDLLDENRDDAIRAIGAANFVMIQTSVMLRRWSYSGTNQRPIRIDEPMHVIALQELHERRTPQAPPLTNRELGRMLGRDGKTIARWTRSMLKAGPPPKNEGCVAYFRNVVKPPRNRGREPP